MLVTFMSVASDINKRQNLTTNSLIIWFLESSCPLFCNGPEPYIWECSVDLSVETDLYYSAFWLLVIFHICLHLLQSEVSLETEASVNQVYTDKYLKCS